MMFLSYCLVFLFGEQLPASLYPAFSAASTLSNLT